MVMMPTNLSYILSEKSSLNYFRLINIKMHLKIMFSRCRHVIAFNIKLFILENLVNIKIINSMLHYAKEQVFYYMLCNFRLQ